jgi:hypothetical protein
MRSPHALPSVVKQHSWPEPIWERIVRAALKDYHTPQEYVRRFIIANIDTIDPEGAADA